MSQMERKNWAKKLDSTEPTNLESYPKVQV